MSTGRYSSIPDSDNGSKKRKHGSSVGANPIDNCVNLIDVADKISHSAKVVLETLKRIEKKHGSLSEEESDPLKKAALAMEKAASTIKKSAATLSPAGNNTLYVQSRLAKMQKVARAQSREPGKTTSQSLQTIEEFVEDVVADVESSKATEAATQESTRAKRSKTSQQEAPLTKPANGVEFECAEAINILLGTKNVMPLITKWIENNWIPCKETACYRILRKLKKKEVDLSDVRWPRLYAYPAIQKRARTEKPRSSEDTALMSAKPANGVEFECAEAMEILLRSRNVIPLINEWIKKNWIPIKQTACYRILTHLKKRELDLSSVCWSKQTGRPQLCSDTELLAACREMMQQNPGHVITRHDVTAILKTVTEKNMAERGITAHAEKETKPSRRTVGRYYSLITADLDAKFAREVVQQRTNNPSSLDDSSSTAVDKTFI